MDGRSDLFQGLENIFTAIGSIINAIKEAFREIFPKKTEKDLANITAGFKDFTEKLKPSEEALAAIKSIFKGVFSVVKIVTDAIKVFINIVGKIWDVLEPVRTALLNLGSALGEWISGLRESMETSKSFERITSGVKTFFEIIGELISKAATKIKGFFGSFSKNDSKGFQEATEGIANSISPIEKANNAFQKFGEKLKEAFAKIKEILSTAWNYIKEIGGKIKAGLEYFFGDLKFDTFVHVIKEIIGLGILNNVRKLSGGLADGAKNIGNALENISGFFQNIRGAAGQFSGIFSDIREQIQSWKKDKSVEILKKVAVSLLLVAGALFIVSKVDSDKIAGSFGAITGMLVELIGALAITNKMTQGDKFSGGNLNKLGLALIELSVAILLIASALKKIGDLDPENMWSSIGVITALITELVIATKLLSTDGEKQIIKGVTGLVSLALALDILTKVISKLGGLDLPTLVKGIGGVLALLISLALTTKHMNSIKFTNGLGLVLLATSLIILGKAVETFSNIPWDNMKAGLKGLGIALAELVLFLNLIPKDIPSKAAGLVILSAAILILGKGISNISEIPWDNMKAGLKGLGIALAELTIALNLIPKNVAGKAAGVLIVSAALLVLGQAMKNIGELGWEKMKVGLAGLAGGLLAITLALVALGSMSAMVAVGAASLLLAGVALIALAQAMKMIGEMGWDEMGQSLLGIIGILATLGIATVILTPILPLMAALGGVLLIFGAALLAIIAPLSILVNLMGLIAKAGIPGVQALLDFITKIGELIPAIAEQIALGIIAFAETIATGGSAIIEAISTILSSILEAIILNLPKIFTVIEMILEGIFNLIIKFAPKLVEAGWTILMSFLKGIRDNIQELVEVGTDIIVNFLKGIEYAIPRIVDEAFNLIIVFIDTLGTTIKDKTPILVDHVWDMAENIVKGLWEGLKHFFEKGKEKIGNFGNWVLETIEDKFGIPHGSIKAGASKFFDMAGQIITGMINGFKEGLKSIGEAVSDVGENIVNGFKNFFHIQSPSRLMRDEVGNYIVDGISEGIKQNTSAEEAARIKAQNIANAFKAEVDKIDFSRQTSDLMNNLWSANQNTTENRLNRLLEEEYAKEKPNERYIKELEAKLAKSEEERTLMQIEQTKGYLQDLQEKEKLAKGEYDVSVNTFGKDSDEARKAWNSFLQAQINTIDKQNELEDLEYTYARDKRDQAEQQRKQNEAIENSYYEWIIKNTKALKQFGYTTEEIQKAASDATGFDPNASQVKMEDATKEATLNSMKAVNETYQENAEDTFGSLNPEFESYGQQYGTNLAKGLKEEKGLVVSESTALSQGSLAALNDHTNEYYEAGKEAGKAYTEGLKEYSNQALNTSNGLYSKSNSALREAYSKKSSEMKATYSDAIKQIAQKEGVDMGVAFDMLKANARGGSYASGVSYNKDALTKDYKELEDISKAIAGDTVSSVLKSGGNATAIVSTVGIKSSTSSSSAKSTSSSVRSSSSSNSSSSSSSSGTTINYTQNISSPKATTNSEIYRSSKTALSAIGSIVSSVSPIGGAVTKIASSLLSGKNPLAN